MAEWTVTVGGQDYDVTAPDERTAWAWANAEHNKRGTQRPSQRQTGQVEGLRNWRPTPEPAFEAEARRTPEMSFAQFLQGTPQFSALKGAASLPLGALQWGANAISPDVGRLISEPMKSGAEREATSRAAQGREGFDVANLVGALASPFNVGLSRGITGVLGPATTLGQKIGQGMLGGALAGGAMPVYSTADPETQKDIRGSTAALGGTVGGSIPLVGGALTMAGRAARDTADLVLPGGAERIATRYQRRILGEDAIPSVTKAARTAPEYVPGSRPTVAEATAHVPEASPILSHQRITAETPGGISALFGQRKLEQAAAIKAAEEARNAVTTPMRDAVLSAVEQQGGVPASAVLGQIDDMLRVPGQRASDVVQKSLNAVRTKIESLTDEATGMVNPRDLYTVRKEIGNIIEQASKDTANWDKKLTGGLQRDVQKAIDDAIESSGGTGWRGYLSEYATRSKAIEDDLARRKASIRPVQRTDLRGGINVSEETRAHIPQMLSRPAMLANAAMRWAGMGVEPKVDRIIGNRYLDPQALADAIERTPVLQRPALLRAMQDARIIPIQGTLAGLQESE